MFFLVQSDEANFIFEKDINNITAVGSLVDLILYQKSQQREAQAGDEVETVSSTILSALANDTCAYVSC